MPLLIVSIIIVLIICKIIHTFVKSFIEGRRRMQQARLQIKNEQAMENMNSDEILKLKLMAENYISNQQWQDAISSYTTLLKNEPKNIDFLYSRADAYIKDNQFSKAVYDYLGIIAINNKETNAYMQLVSIYNSTANYQASKDLLKQAMEVIPDNEKINNAYNHILSILPDTNLEEIANEYLLKEEWEKAITAFSELIKLQPKNIEYLYARAMAYTKFGQLASAIQDYMTLTGIKPDEVDAYLFMAEIYNIAQQFEGTKQVLELALIYRPNDEDIKQAYNEILSILSKDDNNESSSLETINTEIKIQKINIAECTIEEIQSLDLFDNAMLEKFIEFRNSGKVWYDLDSFAMDLELQPHQIMELKDILIFPPKPKIKIGRKLDI